jgi:hypothetical protein
MSAATMLPVVWGEGVQRTAIAAVAVKRQPSTVASERPAEELAFYRKHTQLMLRRFMHMSMQMGRTPSLLGEQVFRGRVSSYRLRSFEDAVIADLCVLKSQMGSLLGDGQPGRLKVLEDHVERHELRWQRAKGFAAAVGVLFTLLQLAVEVIRRYQ